MAYVIWKLFLIGLITIFRMTYDNSYQMLMIQFSDIVIQLNQTRRVIYKNKKEVALRNNYGFGSTISWCLVKINWIFVVSSDVL